MGGQRFRIEAVCGCILADGFTKQAGPVGRWSETGTEIIAWQKNGQLAKSDNKTNC